MADLAFTKMHGVGNDFMVINLVTQRPACLPEGADARTLLTPERIRQWADRHFGVGFDQLLVVEPPSHPDQDFRYRIFNADGSEVEQCGNGARCFARFVLDQGLTHKRRIRVETASGTILLVVEEDGQITVDMGPPVFAPERIPFHPPGKPHQPQCWHLAIEDAYYDVTVLSMGNPHCVMIVDDIVNAPVEFLGPKLESHRNFPARTNVGFMEITARNAINLRVFERGTGETLACGTGACAAVVAGQLRGLLDDEVTVTLAGGKLRIRHALDTPESPRHPVWMTGPAESVYDGVIPLSETL